MRRSILLLLLVLTSTLLSPVVSRATASPPFKGGLSFSSRSNVTPSGRCLPTAVTTATSFQHNEKKKNYNKLVPFRGGASGSSGSLPIDDTNIDAIVKFLGALTQLLISTGRTVLPPTVAAIKTVVHFYQVLPKDLIIAQIGLIYCFAGGYYPTLFSSLQAAQVCGWNVMISALSDLTNEAIKAIEATSSVQWDKLERRAVFLKQTNIVIQTVDPMKINKAASALYTTWLGVSAVLEKKYARTISMSMTLSYYFETVTHWILEPPLKKVIGVEYHKWVPVVLGWGCKAIAMNIAWRIQRILTASTSAMAGGFMFSRAMLRMLHKRRYTGKVGKDDQFDQDKTLLDDVIGFAVAGIGFYTQMEYQYKNGFSFKVPYPINLVTWPFDCAEKWIQWQITK